MMNKYLIIIITFFSFHAYAEIKTGPQIEKLYPVSFYHDARDGLYIEFQQGAMPGCSHEKGGRLSKSNPNYKELYSLLLTMMTTKNFKGYIRYQETNYKGWWHCSIEGIFAFPL
ncbi:hypothetical protein [Vibrio campbellii]|uniref:hypothetical protein n=1 Tax=Vibrio campbellii TaxID=680 RepID=UPI002158385A|nr:hypothetical protein [Vibrio campbellii]